MDLKDVITGTGIFLTFAVSALNLFYSIRTSKKTAYVNTVTTSRLKWIDSLRDKVSEFIAVSVALLDPETPHSDVEIATLCRERDILQHKIILHLNPNDAEDQAIKTVLERVVFLSAEGVYSTALHQALLELRNTTQAYLKKEWTKVKREAISGIPKLD